MIRRPHGAGARTTGIGPSIGITFDDESDRISWGSGAFELTDRGKFAQQLDTGELFFVTSVSPARLLNAGKVGGGVDFIVGPDPTEIQTVREAVELAIASDIVEPVIFIKAKTGGYIDTAGDIPITKAMTINTEEPSNSVGSGTALDMGFSIDADISVFFRNVSIYRASSLGPGIQSAFDCFVTHLDGHCQSTTGPAVDMSGDGIYNPLFVNDILTFEAGTPSLRYGASAGGNAESSTLTHGDFFDFIAVENAGSFSTYNSTLILSPVRTLAGGASFMQNALVNAFTTPSFEIAGFLIIHNCVLVHPGGDGPPYFFGGDGGLIITANDYQTLPGPGLVDPDLAFLPGPSFIPFLITAPPVKRVADGTTIALTNRDRRTNITSITADTDVELPPDPLPGQDHFVAFEVDPGVFSITLVGTSGRTIADNAVGTRTMSLPFQVAHLSFNGIGDGTGNWDLVSKYP